MFGGAGWSPDGNAAWVLIAFATASQTAGITKLLITGGCQCKAVRYAISADRPMAARVCWCRICQYIGAGSGTVNAIFARDAVEITGRTQDFSVIADSGALMHRRFCPICGTPLFSEAEPRPNVIIVRVGTMDDPNLGAPQSTIWTKSAPQWACFDPQLPQAEGQGPAPAKPA